MNVYEYECESCQKRFEKIRKFSDPPLETCDLCGSGPIRKLFSSPAIQFKGSGFYITDYAKKSSTEAGQAGETKSSSSESDSSAKSDSKPSSEKSESSSKTDSSASKSDSPKSKTSSPSGDGAPAKTTTKSE